MAIIDQCFQCRFFNETNGLCSKTEKEPLLDDSPCDMYQIDVPSEDLSKNDTEEVNTPIHGWLVFFCIVLGIGGVGSLISNLPQGDFYHDYGGSIWLMSIDVATGIIGLLLAIYSIFAIIKRKSNAVFYAKSYVILVFVNAVLFLVFDLTDESGYMTSVSHVVGSLVWGVIWFLYLTFSEQVNNRFPKAKRKVGVKDWLFVLSMVYIPLLFFFIYWMCEDSVKVALRQSVNEINSELYCTDGFDSVAYDETSNIFSFYFHCDGEDAEGVLSRDENDLKTMLLSELYEEGDEEVEDFVSLLQKGETTLRYVYQTSSGERVKVVMFSPEELVSGVSDEQKRESVLNMIEKEAEEADAECPYTIDEGLCWNSCTFDRTSVKMILIYSINYDRGMYDENDIDEMKKEFRKNMIESCSESEIYKMAGLTIEIEIRDKDNKFLDRVIIAPEDY